jgi:hypothetical protein
LATAFEAMWSPAGGARGQCSGGRYSGEGCTCERAFFDQFERLAAEIIFDRRTARVGGQFVKPMRGEDHALHGNRFATESRRRQNDAQGRFWKISRVRYCIKP